MKTARHFKCIWKGISDEWGSSSLFLQIITSDSLWWSVWAPWCSAGGDYSRIRLWSIILIFGCCDRSPNFHRWPAVLRHLQLFDCLQVSSLPIHKHLRHTCQKNNRTRKHHSTTMESIEEMVWNRNNCKGMMWMLWTLTVCVIFTPSSWSLTLYWWHYVY